MDKTGMLIIFGKKDPTYLLLKKVVETFVKVKGPSFTFEDLLLQNAFIWDEKKTLKEIFGSHNSYVGAYDFYFTYDNGTWKYKNKDDVTNQYVTKILSRLDGKSKYSLSSRVCPTDLRLLELLIKKYNEYTLEFCFYTYMGTFKMVLSDWCAGMRSFLRRSPRATSIPENGRFRWRG